MRGQRDTFKIQGARLHSGSHEQKFISQIPPSQPKSSKKKKIKKVTKIADNDDYTTEEENFQAVHRPGHVQASHLRQQKQVIQAGHRNKLPRHNQTNVINSIDYMASNRAPNFHSPKTTTGKGNQSLMVRSLQFKSSRSLGPRKSKTNCNSPDASLLQREFSSDSKRVPFQLIRNSRSLFPLNKGS